jgi:hypothetical protein
MPGQPTSITLGCTYEVAEILEDQYSIINDSMKMARYSKYRFEVVDAKAVPLLRANFNMLTLPMRQRIRELEAEVEKYYLTVSQ